MDRLQYITGTTVSVERRLVWVDREGREEAIAAAPRAFRYPRVSPDGRRLALDNVAGEDADIWIWNFARETLTRLTFDPGRDIYAAWTPDGLRVAFASNRDGTMNLFWKAADGTGAVERLAESSNPQRPQIFSPDGTMLMFRENDPRTNADLGVLSIDAEGAFEPLLATAFDEMNLDISPDGLWLAYESNESGQSEVYVRPFPDVDTGRWQISREGGSQPLWAPDGRELFYLSLTGQLMAVPIETDLFAFGQTEVVFEKTYSNAGGGRNYDVSPDDKRFLMIKEGGGDGVDATMQVILIVNWFEELKRLVPLE